MNDTPPESDPAGKRPKRRRRRRLRAVAAVLTLPVIAYVLFRLIYPLWIERTLPADAPRIAFSLDNALIGRLGITDATYQRVMTAAGGRLIPLKPDAAGDPHVDPNTVDALLTDLDIHGVLLTGGGDVDPDLYGGDPNTTHRVNRLRDDFEIALIHAARRRGLPILGICRGGQILNIAAGGSLRNLANEPDPDTKHLLARGHAVDITAGSHLAKLLETERLENVISLHGHCVGELGDAIRIAATGPGDVIEAIEADSADNPGWIMGIQWHPELKITDIQHRVFQTLVDHAKQVQRQRP